MTLPDFTNLGDLIRRDQDPGKLALIDLGGETAPRHSATPRSTRMANAVARGLLARGYRRGERIAILSANRAENLAAYYGIMRAGLVAVPVNFKFPRAMIEFVLADADARLVFCDAPRRGECPLVAGDHLQRPGRTGFDAFLDPGPFEPVLPRRTRWRCSSIPRARPASPRA